MGFKIMFKTILDLQNKTEEVGKGSEPQKSSYIRVKEKQISVVFMGVCHVIA